MAALAASAVALVNERLYGPGEFFPAGKDNKAIITRRLLLTLTGQGGQSNTIGASALGFDRLLSVSSLFDDENNKIYPATIDVVNNLVILADGSAAPAPVDVTSNAAYITVTGTTKQPAA